MAISKPIIRSNANYHCLWQEKATEGSEGDDYFAYRKAWREWPERFFVGPFPLFVDIETTSLCNLTCPFCATTYRAPLIKRGFITFETIRRIIDEGYEKGLYGVKLNCRGEPLLHPQICEFVSYAKDKGLIDVYFNTNAVLLNKSLSERLISAKLDRISISVEGYTKTFYERYRVGANFEVVLENIKTLQRIKKKEGVNFPKLRIQTVLLPELEADLDGYKNFWMEFADEVSYLDYKEMKEKRKGIRYPWACPQLWQRMAIWWDGTVLPCNHDDEGLLNLGKVGGRSIGEMWHSELSNYIRDKHKAGLGHEISACDGCYLRDSEIRKFLNRQ